MDVRDKLKALRDSYIKSLPLKLNDVNDIYGRIKDGAHGEADIANMHRLVHSIAGTSASFGYKEIGDNARRLEQLLKGIIENDKTVDFAALAEIKEYIALLQQHANNAADNIDAGIAKSQAQAVLPSYPADESSVKKVFLVEDDAFLLQTLETQIGHFGYEVRAFAGLDDFREAALKESPPDVIVMDIIFKEGEGAGIDAASEMQRFFQRKIPVVFISVRTDIAARIEAVRAGGEAYLAKPIKVASLMDRLDILTARKEIEPYRILIVDDEVELARYYAAILEDAGMDTKIVNNPMNAVTALVEFNPDLILMDKYMPKCSGDVLAKAIRQMDDYFSIPIVFLSTETDIDKQMKAMRMGGDDFLAKPVQPEHLVSSVSIRADRMRIIRSFMGKDSLTGLLNHTMIKEGLEAAIDRARRQKVALSFAMIDIDKFKSVNDTYGHPAGDRVILSLSGLLQHRLRKTDIIGRYGGEEFAVVFSDTDADNAMRVLDEIRAAFSEIKHQSNGSEFYCTFSAGIAGCPAYDDAAGISCAADKALYEAKRGGRNLLVKAAEAGWKS
jgi:diguanylate cyclase (GGDEF)-like protein